MNIRPYSENNDFNYYVVAEYESFKSTYPGVTITEELNGNLKRVFEEKIKLENVRGFTLVEDSEPIGMVVTHLGEFCGMSVCSIDNVFVSESHRGQGLVSLLFNAAEEDAKNSSAAFMRLGVSVVNDSAVQAYKKMGYETVSLAMEKRL